jgi:hypothetical protein
LTRDKKGRSARHKMEYSEFEEIGYPVTAEDNEESETCVNYYPGLLSEIMDEIQENEERRFEEKFFFGIS